MRQDRAPVRRGTRLWRRRLLAVGVATTVHLALFVIIANDWSAHRASFRDDTIVLTLERPVHERPPKVETAAPQPPRPPSPPLSPRAADSAALPIIPPTAFPTAVAGPATLPPTPPEPQAAAAPQPINIGCIGATLKNMSAAARRECDTLMGRRAEPGRAMVEALKQPTALDGEFAAAYAERRKNDPSVRPRKPTDCPLANISGCSTEDMTIRIIGKKF